MKLGKLATQKQWNIYLANNFAAWRGPGFILWKDGWFRLVTHFGAIKSLMKYIPHNQLCNMMDLILSINISIFIEDGSNGFVGFLSPRLFVLERGSPSFRGELSLGSRWWILNTRVARATSLQTAPTPLEMLYKGSLPINITASFQTYFLPTKEGSETREDYDGQASEQSKNSRVWQWLWTWLDT